jgi:hypothetical protein
VRRQPISDPNIDPFVFVMAERYAIRRYLTSAAETAAAEIELHADTIKRDAGATSAIINDVDDLLKETEPDHSLASKQEWQDNRDRWERVRAHLRA